MALDLTPATCDNGTMLVLGNNNIGLTQTMQLPTGTCIAVGPFKCLVDGTVDIFQLYGNNQGGTGNFQCGLYSDDAGEPDEHLGHGVSGALGAVYGWASTVVSIPISVVAGRSYWVCFEIEETCSICLDIRATESQVNKANGYGVWADPFGEPDSTVAARSISLFAGVTPTGPMPPGDVHAMVAEGIIGHGLVPT